jgi:hypothetical protein
MGGLSLRGQAEVIVRDVNGQVKDRHVFDNNINSSVPAYLMGAVVSGEQYPEALVPSGIYCKLDNNLQTNLGQIGDNHSTSGLLNGTSIATEFSVYGLQADFGSDVTAAAVNAIYLMGQGQAGDLILDNVEIARADKGANIDPNVLVTQNDTIDVNYQIIIARPAGTEPYAESQEFMRRLSYIIRGIKRADLQGVMVDYDVQIRRARLYNRGEPDDFDDDTLLKEVPVYLSRNSATGASGWIRFDSIRTLPNEFRVYIYDEIADSSPEVSRWVINAPGWGDGDNVLVPLSVDFYLVDYPVYSPTSGSI